MKKITLLLLLVGCATPEQKNVATTTTIAPHKAKWCLEENPTKNCSEEKGFYDASQCLQFILTAPKKGDVGYWVCELDPTREW